MAQTANPSDVLDHERMIQLKEEARKEYEERKALYETVTNNPTVNSLAEHIVNLYEADTQYMRQEIINTAMFKTLFDIMLKAKLATAEEFDELLAENLANIENAYAEQYEKFEEFMASQEQEADTKE